jgi:hypothetical protein
MQKKSLQPAMVSAALIAALCLFVASCAPVVIGGAAVGATYAYAKGWMERDYEITLDQAYNASLQAVQALDMEVIEKNKGLASAEIRARKNDETYWIKINSKSENLSQISVRTGLLGNKDASRVVQREIEQKIG